MDNFTVGIAPVQAKDKFGVGFQEYKFKFSPTDFMTLTSDNCEAMSANTYTMILDLFANVGSEAKLPDTPSYGASSGGGCSAGFAALALLAMIPLTLRKKK